MGGLERSAQHQRPGGPELGPHVGARPDAGGGEAGDEAADAALGIGVMRAFLTAGVDVVTGVVHDELDVGMRDGRGTDVPR